MILDSLQNKERYVSLHPRFKAVFDFIDTHDVAALPCGRHEIDGDNIFVNVGNDAKRGWSMIGVND